VNLPTPKARQRRPVDRPTSERRRNPEGIYDRLDDTDIEPTSVADAV